MAASFLTDIQRTKRSWQSTYSAHLVLDERYAYRDHKNNRMVIIPTLHIFTLYLTENEKLP